MRGVPMSPTEYALALRGVELADEYDQVQRKLDAGHEFVALMQPGGQVFVSGEWRTIDSLAGQPQDRIVIYCTDGTGWLANRTATRRYREAAS